MFSPSGYGAPPRRIVLLFWSIVAAIPIVYIGIQAVAASRNVVFWDEFASLDFVLRLKAPHTWVELLGRFFSVDSEHRTFTTRLIFALDYWCTGAVNFHLIGAIGNLSLVLFCALLVQAAAGPERRLRLAVLLAFGLFQLEHFEAFVWSGASIDHFQVLLLAGASLLTLHRGSRGATLGAALLALLATLTLAHGCVTWPIGALMLGRRRQWARLAGWLALGATTLGLYFYGFQIDPSHQLHLSPGEGARLVQYWLALLGSAPVLGRRDLAPFAGIVLLGTLGWLVRRGAWARHPVVLPLAGFAVGSLVLVAIGRLEVAPPEMINSRYFVLGALAWTMTAYVLLEEFTSPRAPFLLLACLLPFLIAFNLGANLRFGPLAQTMVEARDRAASRFKQFGEDGHGGFRLHPFDGRTEQILQEAKAAGIYQLPRYSERRDFPLARETTRIVTYVDELIASRRAVTIGGWAMIPGVVSKRGHVYVVLRTLSATFVYSTLTLQRTDVAKAYNEPRWRLCGFRAVIGRDRLPKENFEVGVLIEEDGQAEYAMTSNRVLLSADDPAVAARLASQP